MSGLALAPRGNVQRERPRRIARDNFPAELVKTYVDITCEM
jgi:uncharacterized protein (UPF0297 family)